MRCLVLASELRQRGIRTVFIMAAHAKAGADRIAAVGCELEEMPDDLGQEQQAAFIAARAAANKDWVVVDHYALDEIFQLALSRAGLSVCAIDDLATHPFPVQVLVNQNTDAEQLQYRVGPDSRILLGPRYALVGPAYRAARPPKPRSLPRVDSILVSFGGSDPVDATSRVLQSLGAVPLDVRITVVCGTAYRHLEALNVVLQNAPHPVRVVQNATDLSQLLLEADLLIGAGGSTCWEACCLGTPMILMPIADNQTGVATSLARLGVALHPGSAEDACEDVGQLIRDISPAGLRRMAERAWSLVDGFGAARIADVMEANGP